MLLQSKQVGTDGAAAAGNPESAGLAEAITEAKKVYESSLRYNATQVNLWESYLLFLQDNSTLHGSDADD